MDPPHIGVYSLDDMNMNPLWELGITSNRSLMFAYVQGLVYDATHRLNIGEDALEIFLDYRQLAEDVAEQGLWCVPDWDELMSEHTTDQALESVGEMLHQDWEWNILALGPDEGSLEEVAELAGYLMPLASLSDAYEFCNLFLEHEPNVELLLVINGARCMLHVVRSKHTGMCGLVQSEIDSRNLLDDRSADALSSGPYLTYVLPVDLEYEITDPYCENAC